jgi:hypothetical protein
MAMRKDFSSSNVILARYSLRRCGTLDHYDSGGPLDASLQATLLNDGEQYYEQPHADLLSPGKRVTTAIDRMVRFATRFQRVRRRVCGLIHYPAFTFITAGGNRPIVCRWHANRSIKR